MINISQIETSVLDQFEAKKIKWSFHDFEHALEQALGEDYGNYQTSKLIILAADRARKWPKTVERYIRTNYEAFGSLPIELNHIGARLNLFPPSPAFQFEKLVWRILEANGFKIDVAAIDKHDAGFDFTATVDNEIWAIEVKFYRTARAQFSLLESAASRLASRGVIAGAWKGMLVVSCHLPAALRAILNEKFSVTFVDRTDLLNLAAKNPSLIDELNSLLESSPATVQEQYGATEPNIIGKRLPEKSLPEDTKGTELCRELKSIKRGKSTWSAYEELCDRILKYLFPNDLHGWHRQKRTDDGLNRFDYICRIKPTTEFWNFVLNQLDSRYVLFEFKNYSGKIKQGQILTTEKYLLERGLRRVAIIISRAGADIGAIKMTQGAMREHGKLMLVIDENQVCDMLHMKERGEDPTDRLFELADNFLVTLPR